MAIMEVNVVDTTTRTVSDGIMTLDCDYLIVATGATHAYFGHPNYAQFAPASRQSTTPATYATVSCSLASSQSGLTARSCVNAVQRQSLLAAERQASRWQAQFQNYVAEH